MSLAEQELQKMVDFLDACVEDCKTKGEAAPVRAFTIAGIGTLGGPLRKAENGLYILRVVNQQGPNNGNKKNFVDFYFNAAQCMNVQEVIESLIDIPTIQPSGRITI